MKSVFLHHALPVLGLWLLSFTIGVLLTPVDALLTALVTIGCFSVGMAAYVLGVQVGRQTDPLRPRYLQLRVPSARESTHTIASAMLSAAVTLFPAAWLLRDGVPGADASDGWTAVQRVLLKGYWGPMTLGLLLLTWSTRNPQREAAPSN